MRTQLNYQALFELEKDIETQVQNSPAFGFFHQEKIRRFVTQNQHRLDVMHKTQQAIRDKYVLKDEEGKLVTKDGEDGGKLWAFATGEDEINYLKEWNKFMQITFDVNI